MTAKFNPDPKKPYGRCATCDVSLLTRKDVDTHLRATFTKAGNRHESHRVTVVNPSRKEQVSTFIHEAVDEAIEKVLYRFAEMIINGELTEEEVRQNLDNIKLHQFWEEYIELQQPFLEQE